MIVEDANQKQIEDVLSMIQQHYCFLVLGHQSPDGDCVGSIVALCAFLRSIGKKAFCMFDGDLPHKFDFLHAEEYTVRENIFSWDEYDCVISLDCGNPFRIAGRTFDDIQKAGISLICIDHHQETPLFGEVNLIDSNASATGELIYDMLVAARGNLDKNVAQSLFAAIVADTGSFSFANTSERVLKIAAHLVGLGADPVEVNENLFLVKSYAELKLISRTVERVSFLFSGLIALSYVETNDFNEFGIKPMDDTDSLVNALRYIEGVKVAVLCKEIDPDKVVKVSLRSDRMYDVSEIAREFGGGGHQQAAGFTYTGGLREAIEKISKCLLSEVGKG